MYIRLKEDWEELLKELQKRNPEVKVGKRVNEDQIWIGGPYVEIGSSGAWLDIDEETLENIVPKELIKEFSVHQIVNDSPLRRQGIYRKGSTEIRVETHCSGNDRGDAYFQKYFITGQNFTEMKQAYRDLRAGKLFPEEDWEAPQIECKPRSPRFSNAIQKFWARVKTLTLNCILRLKKLWERVVTFFLNIFCTV